MADVETTGTPEVDPQFEPVHKLNDSDKIATTTGEENDTVIFKMRAKLFRFDKPASEWKERGTGEVKILQPPTGKIRLVMRRDKTLKVCANHVVTSDMTLAPNIGSDRSWVWNVAADVSDGEPTQETLAIRFANAENAALFKAAFEKAQEDNKASGTTAAPDSDSAAAEPTPKADDQAAAVEASKADPSPEPIAAPAAKSEGEFVATPAAVDAVKEQDKKADEGVDVKATGAGLVPEAGEEEKKTE